MPKKISEKENFQRWMTFEGLKRLNPKAPFSLFSRSELSKKLNIKKGRK